MITQIALANYRSLLNVSVQVGALNVVTGANGSGKSNMYRAMKLLSETARGDLVRTFAEEGGLSSLSWAGPERISQAMRDGRHAIEATAQSGGARIRFGFATEEFSYALSLGARTPMGNVERYVPTSFTLDPAIKRECIWVGPLYRPAACLVDRHASVVKLRAGQSWEIYAEHMPDFESILSELADPERVPEIFRVRSMVRDWRFYDHFRTDRDSPIRQPQIGTLTPVLSHDGYDLAAALQTIIEIGERDALARTIEDAFPGSQLNIAVDESARFSVNFTQPGMLRPLTARELSDGTLKYFLLVAALLSPRPPSLLVLNEPENSLHPSLIPALARLIAAVAEKTQVWVVSHAPELVHELKQVPVCNAMELEKDLGETCIKDQSSLDAHWNWPDE